MMSQDGKKEDKTTGTFRWQLRLKIVTRPINQLTLLLLMVHPLLSVSGTTAEVKPPMMPLDATTGVVKINAHLRK